MPQYGPEDGGGARVQRVRDRLHTAHNVSAGQDTEKNENVTLHAETSIQVDTSAFAPSAINMEHFSLTGSLSRRKVVPQSSATALWTSGLHLGSTSWKAFQVSSTTSEGTRTYFKKDAKVSKSVVTVSAERERGSSLSKASKTSMCSGVSVVRRSWDNC